MAKTASVVICLMALAPSTAAAAGPLPNPQSLVGDATSAVMGATTPEAIRSTAQDTTSNVHAVVGESTGAVGRAAAVPERVRAVVDSARAASPAAATAPSSDSGWAIQPESRNAVGRAAGAISGTAETIGARIAASSAAPPTFFAALPTAAELRPQAAASSAPVESGGEGHDDPDGPGGVTGGISGPLGFVLIAAVLAGIFLMAPRFIGSPRHMTSWRPRSAALVLPIEWPD